MLHLQEQIIEDCVTGLTLTLEAVPESEAATYRIRINGDLPFGNRDIFFDREGKLSGMGTTVKKELVGSSIRRAT